MPDPELTKELRRWMRLDGARWSKQYAALDDARKHELIEKYKQKHADQVQFYRERFEKARRESTPAAGAYSPGPVCSTLEHGTGGGWRNIRKPGGLS